MVRMQALNTSVVSLNSTSSQEEQCNPSEEGVPVAKASPDTTSLGSFASLTFPDMPAADGPTGTDSILDQPVLCGAEVALAPAAGGGTLSQEMDTPPLPAQSSTDTLVSATPPPLDGDGDGKGRPAGSLGGFLPQWFGEGGQPELSSIAPGAEPDTAGVALAESSTPSAPTAADAVEEDGGAPSGATPAAETARGQRLREVRELFVPVYIRCLGDRELGASSLMDWVRKRIPWGGGGGGRGASATA